MYEEEPQVELTNPLLSKMKMCKIFKDTVSYNLNISYAQHREINSIDFSADGT